ncbi:MAG: extracellular solute-binding protein [Burkholderiales bacterium]|nr:extracellular solute-binding protein [Anaerolineae bacterium]
MAQSKFLFRILLATALLLGAFGVSFAQEAAVNLTVMCRCVQGGTNNSMFVWLTTFVIPTFEELMAQQGRDVHVEFDGFDGTDEEHKAYLFEALRSDEAADLLSMDGFWVADFASEGLLSPLENVAGESVNEWDGWDHIPEGIRSIMRFRGDVYGVPIGTDVRMIFYRRDLFQAAGIPFPWQPMSWGDVLDAGRALKAVGVETPIQINAGTAMGEATTMQGYFMTLLSAGGHMYDFDQEKWIVSSPAMLEALNFYASIYGDEALGDPEIQLAADGRERSFEAFEAGRIGMLVESDWFWRDAVVDVLGVEERNNVVGWAMMPAIEPGLGYQQQDFVSISGGGGWVMNPDTEHPAEAWALLAHMSSIDSARAFEILQPRISFRDDVPVEGDAVMTAMGVALLPLSTTRPLLPEYAQVSYEAQLMTERVVSGEMTPEEAIAAYAEAVEEIVGAENVISIE